jgi:hypothetical protein
VPGVPVCGLSGRELSLIAYGGCGSSYNGFNGFVYVYVGVQVFSGFIIKRFLKGITSEIEGR